MSNKVVGVGNAGVGKTCLIKHFCETKAMGGGPTRDWLDPNGGKYVENAQQPAVGHQHPPGGGKCVATVRPIGTVGPTALCYLGYIQFSAGYQPTVGVDYGFKIQSAGSIDMRVHLWDLSGNPEYADVRNELYGSTDAIFLVFDVSNAASFADVEAWLREIVKYNNPMPEVCLVANKIDLWKKGGVSQTDAKKWASRHKLNYYETSCATGDGVEKMFSELLTAVLQKRKIGNKPN